MLRVLPKLLLVGTSFAPVLLTCGVMTWFEASNGWTGFKQAWPYFSITVALVLFCLAVMRSARRELPSDAVEIKQIKPADKELIGFVIAYLLPLARGSGFETLPLIVVLIVFFLVVMTSNAYHTNPLLGLLGWHFYEVIIEDVGYILVSRRNVHNVRGIKRVVHLTDYMLADATD